MVVVVFLGAEVEEGAELEEEGRELVVVGRLELDWLERVLADTLAVGREGDEVEEEESTIVGALVRVEGEDEATTGAVVRLSWLSLHES